MAKFSLVLVISFTLFLFASVHDASTKTILLCKTKGLYWSGPFPGISDNPHGAPPAETTKRLLHVVPVKPPNTQSKAEGLFQTSHGAPPAETTNSFLYSQPAKPPNVASKTETLF
ncbi:hypothetical protein F2Q68_00000070 [Brassica cretica]|uniref:Uncharacterized protein n=1 Tax=Brassica cretica TaxID=69181 RepID=A0A8S9JK61_BRACR|nr:hypothetical protein F2Q68_00000070 [Brassica cretica]